MARNKKSEIDKIKAMVWFRAVAISTGIPKAYGLELKFDKNKTKIVNKKLMRPRKWDAWRDGLRTPSKSEVDRIEFSVPGCARWFYHPIWDLLNKANVFNNARDIDNFLLKLPTVKYELFEKIDRSEELVRISRHTGKFYHPYLIPPHIVGSEDEPDILACFDNLDNLAAILALEIEALLINNAKAHLAFLNDYFEAKYAISKIPELNTVVERIFCYIENYAQWTYQKPRGKTESEAINEISNKMRVEHALFLMNQRNPWNPENIALLGVMSDVSLAKKLGITVERVRYRRKEKKIAKFIDPRFQYAKDRLDLLKGELSNKELAIKLKVSIDTIKRHRKKEFN